jgi:putative hydrolase of the HAD superfamily
MRQHLIIDADDTLWENNVYFEQAIDQFVEFLAHATLSAAQVRAALDEVERVNAKTHGYGALSFSRNLQQCYEQLAQRIISETDLATVRRFAERILEQPIEVIDGVPETLAYLAERHELTLFTKGHAEEQRLKVARSGLAGYFARLSIVPEKDAAAFRALVATHGMNLSRSWMIGNSPKSDVNPALQAGLNAVFVPHARTWTLEHEEIRSGPGRLLLVGRFSDLRTHF